MIFRCEDEGFKKFFFFRFVDFKCLLIEIVNIRRGVYLGKFVFWYCMQEIKQRYFLESWIFILKVIMSKNQNSLFGNGGMSNQWNED